MTREQASNILDDYDVNFDGHTVEEIAEAFDVAFKALEQATVLDKIRAEIASYRSRDKGWGYNDGLAKALEIIDKYKTGK